MLTLAALLILQEPTPAAPPSPEIAAIQAACRRIAEAESYTVTQTNTEEGGGFGGPPPAPPAGAEGAAAPPQPPQPPAPLVFTAQVQKGKPTHFQMQDLEAWREQAVLVHRAAGGAWERFEMQQGGRGFGGGQGGGDPAAARALRTRLTLATTRMAHEIVAGFETKLADAAVAREGGKSVYSGKLTPEGAASLAMGGFGRRGGRGGQQGGQGGQPGGGQQGGQGGQQGGGQGAGPPPFESSGSYRIVVGADGALESLTLDLLTKGTFNDQAFERKRRTEILISAVGATALEVPAEVTKKIAEKPEETVEF